MEWFHGRRRPFLTWGLHGQIQHRGGLWLALLMPYDRDFLHGGGSYAGDLAGDSVTSSVLTTVDNTVFSVQFNLEDFNELKRKVIA